MSDMVIKGFESKLNYNHTYLLPLMNKTFPFKHYDYEQTILRLETLLRQ